MLKRKRSAVTLSSPPGGACSFSSLPQDPPASIPFFYTQSKPSWSQHFSDPVTSWKSAVDGEPRHLNSRTRKRHRDDRPDEEEVHTNTMNKLFEAQRRPQTAMMPDHEAPEEPLPGASHLQSQAHNSAQGQGIQPQPIQQPRNTHQQSLLRFWGPSGPVSSTQQFINHLDAMDTEPTTHANQSFDPVMYEDRDSEMGEDTVAQCEDCGECLTSDNIRREVGMIINDGAEEIDRVMACGACRKRVCDMCAVQGMQRRCLDCARHGR